MRIMLFKKAAFTNGNSVRITDTVVRLTPEISALAEPTIVQTV